ncbi:MAG: phosphoenolpyruvate--protein phosphotransferase [Victivallales bacterium]|jgi:phosphotransferase system enzyme I (PtsI)|nr:phosphoenolpyruvate--protein phosphotransferase [Victivallales bacterium]
MALPTQTIQAIAVSPGIAIGRTTRIIDQSRHWEPQLHKITADEVDSELSRYVAALALTRTQLINLRKEVRDKLQAQDAEIFDAHIMIVDDHKLNAEVEKGIKTDHFSAEYALYITSEHVANVFSAMPDEYLRERSADIRDVTSRILSNLTNIQVPGQELDLDARRIIVAHSLSPSETAELDIEKVLGFAVETGSVTSHAAILARSMHLPAIVGIPPELPEQLTADDKIIIDGFGGKLVINPDARTEEAYRLKKAEVGQIRSRLESESELQPETTDGFIVQLAANLDSPDKIAEVKRCGASGIGLFRTEYLFMNRSTLPNEEEQFEVYKKILAECDNAPLIVRTLDVGGDKFNTNIYRANEQNPFLGFRGIRLCLHERRDILETQLRALLRAGVFGNLKIMLPMVSSIREVIEVRSIVGQLQHQLKSEGKEYVSDLSLGVMVETPAAALMADKLAPLVDFFSIGSNDLVQYTMAIDRGNERVAYLYRPSHPAILELIRVCVDAARKHNIWVSVCGQIAADVYMVPLLIGLGVHELSMTPSSVAVVRRVIRSMAMYEMEQAAQAALNCTNATDALAIAEVLINQRVPEVANI